MSYSITLWPSGDNANTSLLHRLAQKLPLLYLFLSLSTLLQKCLHLFDTLLLLFPLVTSAIFSLLCSSSSLLPVPLPCCFFSPLQFAPPSFSPPSPFPPGSNALPLPLSLPLSKLQRSPLSLCLREFNRSVSRISTLRAFHKPCTVSHTPISGPKTSSSLPPPPR